MANMADLKIVDVLDYASGSADRPSAAIDMTDNEWVIFVVKFAAVAAGATTNIAVQCSSDDAAADAYTDLAGTGVTIAADDDDQSFAVAVYRPVERYLRVNVNKDAANATAECAIAILSPSTRPALASVTDEITVELWNSPAEGTA